MALGDIKDAGLNLGKITAESWFVELSK